MRRCLNEALAAARGRRAFGRAIGEYPLLRRQLMKIMLPTEQALSMYAFSADAMGRADKGDKDAANLLRILTPVYKFRACRDNIPVASHALEVRGRPRLHRGMGDRAPGARRADRHAVGGHLQHQRARRGAARRRQVGRPQDARRRAARRSTSRAARCPASTRACWAPRSTASNASSRRSPPIPGTRSAPAWPPARSITPRRRRCSPGRAPRSARRAAMPAACCCRAW